MRIEKVSGGQVPIGKLPLSLLPVEYYVILLNSIYILIQNLLKMDGIQLGMKVGTFVAYMPLASLHLLSLKQNDQILGPIQVKP